MDQQTLIKTLYRPLQPMAERLLADCLAEGLRVRVPQTGALRTIQDQVLIYGERGRKRWSLHLVGLALDVEPVLAVRPENWQREYNTWPHWNTVQCKLAVAAGFDHPANWQIQRDRPHNQCLFGVSESVLRNMYYSSGNVEEIHRYIDLHL